MPNEKSLPIEEFLEHKNKCELILNERKTGINAEVDDAIDLYETGLLTKTEAIDAIIVAIWPPNAI